MNPLAWATILAPIVAGSLTALFMRRQNAAVAGKSDAEAAQIIQSAAAAMVTQIRGEMIAQQQAHATEMQGYRDEIAAMTAALAEVALIIDWIDAGANPPNPTISQPLRALARRLRA